MRGLVIRIIVLLIGLAASTAFLLDWNSLVGSGDWQWTNDAAIEGPVTQLAARVEGYVSRVPVKDMSIVHAGETILEIERDNYQERFNQAEASLKAAEDAEQVAAAQIAAQEAQIASSKAQVAEVEADLVQANLQKERQTRLLGTPAGLPKAYQDALAAAMSLTQQKLAREFDVKSAEAQLDALKAQYVAAEANVKAQQAARDNAAINLGWTRIVAPENGSISELRARKGQLLSTGTAIATFAPSRVWIIANYQEIQLERVHPGQPVSIHVDAFPAKELHGHVEQIGPASQAESAALPPNRAVGTFTRITQRLPITISVDVPSELTGLLKPGMNVETTVNTARR
jgi:membrane fusion protein, multidrug efflux system